MPLFAVNSVLVEGSPSRVPRKPHSQTAPDEEHLQSSGDQFTDSGKYTQHLTLLQFQTNTDVYCALELVTLSLSDGGQAGSYENTVVRRSRSISMLADGTGNAHYNLSSMNFTYTEN